MTSILVVCSSSLDGERRTGAGIRVAALYRAVAAEGLHVDVRAIVSPPHETRRRWSPAPGLTVEHVPSWAASLGGALAVRLPGVPAVAWIQGPLAPFAPRCRRAGAAYDLVIYEGPYGFGRFGRGARATVLSAHNCERDFVAPLAARGPVGRASVAYVARLEARAVRGCDAIVACSDDDLARLRALYRPALAGLVVPNGYDEGRASPPSPDERARARVALGVPHGAKVGVFVGSDSLHNVRGLRALLAAFRSRAGADTWIVVAGRVASHLEPGVPRVRLLGPVADLRPAYACADVALNPVATGSGTSLKTVEALAMGLPLLTTGFGARGFGGARGIHRMDLDGMVDGLRDPAQFDRPDPAEGTWSAWSALGASYAAFLRQLADGRRARARA